MKIVGMMLTYNESDIIEEVIEHLIGQGIELVVLDNGSTDGTYEICKKFAENGDIKLKQIKTRTFDFHLDYLYRALYDFALTQNPDWVIRSDSDEFLESGIKGLSLKDAISNANSERCNLIQFDVFNFYMSDVDEENEKSVKDKIKYYSWRSDFNYRAWKVILGINVEYHVHFPVFTNGIKYKIFSNKFVLRHYPFRNKKQVEEKIKGKSRGVKDKKKLARYTQQLLDGDPYSKIDHSLLTKYEEDYNWNRELKYLEHKGDLVPLKEEIFTEDGELKIKFKTRRELEIELYNLRKNTLELRLRQKVYLFKKLLKKLFQKKS